MPVNPRIYFGNMIADIDSSTVLSHLKFAAMISGEVRKGMSGRWPAAGAMLVPFDTLDDKEADVRVSGPALGATFLF